MCGNPRVPRAAAVRVRPCRRRWTRRLTCGAVRSCCPARTPCPSPSAAASSAMHNAQGCASVLTHDKGTNLKYSKRVLETENISLGCGAKASYLYTVQLLSIFDNHETWMTARGFLFSRLFGFGLEWSQRYGALSSTMILPRWTKGTKHVTRRTKWQRSEPTLSST